MSSIISKVWSKAATVRGKNPNLYRRDPYNNIMYKPSYGKASEMGWEIDHIKPVSRGGSDSIYNLQALNTSINRSKGNSLVKRSRHNQG
ncbi:MAG: HNH endonuclease [Alphaproteobacteria bacterium]|nr:HNH endonuclease [Alphaproteobacteria bacterium]